ncbi:hypothetical protein OC861_001165 [Tilletia horrida]|nr:hypothetical protein OC845_001194 [Tilletia horrida]KAK0569239.1 hypothetical protein OC861_001165 [Tilletia horrida]
MPPPKPKADTAVKAEKEVLAVSTQSEVKLTKAQQKALKFKDKTKKKGSKFDPDGGDVPVADEEGAEAAQPDTESAAAPRKSGSKGKSKALAEPDPEEAPTSKSKKRQRESEAEQPEVVEEEKEDGEGDNDQDTESTAPKKKKRRKSKGGVDPSKPRLIVFVGNMSFKVTAQQLASHFGETCGETPSVRLLTRKVEPADPPKLSASKLKSIAKGKASGPRGKAKEEKEASKGEADPNAVPMGKDGKPLSRGCAFLEFTTAAALQKALRFHHTQFGGRQINVELTAGGGGKSSGRVEKIKAKNTELETERQKLHSKYVAPGAADKKAAAAERKSQQQAAKEGVAQWGPRAGKGTTHDSTKSAGRGKKWTPSGANATRLTAV